ncbi:molybdopterin-dependent oxidoreductase [Aminobacter anthyllidis]|uniref:Molybdopterin-dependent oxidoreductase n=2 Tax=Aminobacter anthyllidis TaxID=1035067 RepID=A0A9X1D777_9HYPH|nr:molybdopterin-dependent oxidoreductase [Aminobacter anthyllidis]
MDPSPIGDGMIGTLDDKSRIRLPMVRRSWLEDGPGSRTELRGAEPFVAVTWDTVETLVAAELTRVIEAHGNSAIFAGSYGWSSAGRFHHAQSQIHRFFNCIGGYTRSVNTYSFAAAEVVLPYILGNFFDLMTSMTSWPIIRDHTKLFVAFGGMPLRLSQISAGGAGRHTQKHHMASARDAGVEFVNIGPMRSDLEEQLFGEWMPIRPNTDTALLLAIAHTLYTEKLYDWKFIERYTSGFEKFVPYLLGASDGIPKSAAWAAAICDFPAQDILQLARRMASSRTMISLSWSLTRQECGEQPYWAAVTVAAMLGQIGLPGGGVGFGYGAENAMGDERSGVSTAALPQGRNPVSDFIPVARIADMLLNPGDWFDYNGGSYQYPDVRVVYWAGGNPFHHHQDLNNLLLAWRKPETIIVNEWCWNATAKHSDIVLPCTTALERDDLVFSRRDPFVFRTKQIAKPAGAARDDFEIFRGIARHMNAENEFTDGRTAGEWQHWIYETTREISREVGIELPTFEWIDQHGWCEIPGVEELKSMLADFRSDPVRNPLTTPTGRIEIFSDVIASYDYQNCLGHAAWLEPSEWLGKVETFPLHLISNQPSTKLHSQLDHGQVSRAKKVHEREPITIHPADAAERNIGEGDVVRVFNSRGACLAGAVLSTAIRPGVVQMSTGSWFDPEEPGRPGSLCKHGNPNILTKDVGTSSLTQGPTALTCLVDVEVYRGNVPDMTAFDPPEIVGADALQDLS